MERLEVTWWRATKIWWSITWRSFLYTMLIALPAGVVVGLLCTAFQFREGTVVIARLVGAVIGIPIAIWVTKVVMEKQFSDFQIFFVPSFESMLDKQQGADHESEGKS
jgi:uncharacterized membrane protein YeaQ/YmgE (transglycosylase-associated protein family)